MKNSNYKIQDWFEHPNFGVIVSIANPELDQLSKGEIKDRIGNLIAILNNDTQEKKLIEVYQVEVSTSIIDKKNVHICLGNLIKLSDIKPNSSIVLLDEELNIEGRDKPYEHQKESERLMNRFIEEVNRK